MVKNSDSAVVSAAKKVKNILIAQAQPDGAKSPYTDIAKKYALNVDYYPFVVITGIPAKKFRRQKIDITAYTAVIFTSRNAIDHFFRICEEMKITIAQDTKFFWITDELADPLLTCILSKESKGFSGAC